MSEFKINGILGPLKKCFFYCFFKFILFLKWVLVITCTLAIKNNVKPYLEMRAGHKSLGMTDLWLLVFLESKVHRLNCGGQTGLVNQGGCTLQEVHPS